MPQFDVSVTNCTNMSWPELTTDGIAACSAAAAATTPMFTNNRPPLSAVHHADIG